MDDGFDERTARWKTDAELGLRVAEAGASGALMGAGFGAIGSAAGYRNLVIPENGSALAARWVFPGKLDMRLSAMFRASAETILSASAVQARRNVVE